MAEPTRVAVLTPEGTGAIATLALVGPDSWAAVRQRFTPQNRAPLPDAPVPGAVWFGRVGTGVADEVVLCVPPEGSSQRVELHCHGGVQVVGWLIELFESIGCVQATWQDVLPDWAPCGDDPRAWAMLPYARTARTAAILLDQCRGAFRSAIATILSAMDAREWVVAEQGLRSLTRYGSIGQHLTEPLHVVVVGAPNAGKSSLLNALAGFQRSVVTPVPGTTRDVVTVALALDGWPIELADTAGLRESADELEREGMARARAALAAADLCLWLLDTTSHPVGPTFRLIEETGANRERILFVLTKIDQKPTWDLRDMPQAVRVSAKHGDGMDELMQRIVRWFVPNPPPPGAAVPFTPKLAEQVERAYQLLRAGQYDAARLALGEA